MFEVGDRVRVLGNSGYRGITRQVGEVIEVIEVKTYSRRTPLYLVRLKDYPAGLNFKADWIKKVKLNWFQKLFSR